MWKNYINTIPRHPCAQTAAVLTRFTANLPLLLSCSTPEDMSTVIDPTTAAYHPSRPHATSRPYKHSVPVPSFLMTPPEKLEDSFTTRSESSRHRRSQPSSRAGSPRDSAYSSSLSRSPSPHPDQLVSQRQPLAVATSPRSRSAHVTPQGKRMAASMNYPSPPDENRPLKKPRTSKLSVSDPPLFSDPIEALNDSLPLFPPLVSVNKGLELREQGNVGGNWQPWSLLKQAETDKGEGRARIVRTCVDCLYTEDWQDLKKIRAFTRAKLARANTSRRFASKKANGALSLGKQGTKPRKPAAKPVSPPKPAAEAAMRRPQRNNPKKSSFDESDFTTSAPSTKRMSIAESTASFGSPAPASRVKAAPKPSKNEDEFAWQSIPDYTPPVTFPDNNPRRLKADWKGTLLDLSGDPNRQYMHEAELALASALRLYGWQYLSSKRRIFEARVQALRNGKEFRKTDAQQACKIDVNKASKLWTAFKNVGWFEAELSRKYL